MSLNDDALADLSKEDGFVTTPEEAVAEEKPPLLVNVVDKDNNKNTEEAAELLSNYDVTLKTAEDGLTRLHSMDEVVDTVMASESISRSDAFRLVKVFESFAETVGSPSEFTETPSQTNYKATQRFVVSEVSKEREAALATVEKFVNTELAQAQLLLKGLAEMLLPDLFATLDRLRTDALCDLNKAALSKAFLCYDKDKTLVDLRQRSFNCWADYDESTTCPKHMPSTELMRQMQQVIAQDDFRRLLHNAESFGSSPIAKIQWSLAQPTPAPISWNYLEMLAFYASGRALDLLSTLTELIGEQAPPLYDKIGEIMVVKSDPDSKISVLRDFMPELREHLSLLMGLYRYQVVMRSVAHYSSEVMSVFRMSF